MTLKEQMAIDLVNTFLNSDEFSATATVTLVGQSTTFSLALLPGDVVDSYAGDGLGQTRSREMQATCQRSAWRTGTETPLGSGNARNPARGDALALTEPGYVGTWYVRAIASDVGDAFVLVLTDTEREALAGEDVAELL